ncbi:MAG: septum formation initiator family protein [Parcubacteria group bacterium]|nr:septum formation initiator family protein [Parcubacteria group bacterium]MCR4342465.1 septum formation initiator family protein [Patescibacteria group bacterium]
MREFQQRRILRRLMYSNVSIFFLLVIFIFFIFSIADVYNKSREAIKKNEEVSSELNDIKSKKDYFEAEIDRLNTNAGIEDELRDKFQIAKPGERVIIIVDDKKDDSEDATPRKSLNWFWNIFGR